VGSSDGFIIEDVSVVDAGRKLAFTSSASLADVCALSIRLAFWAHGGLPDVTGIGKQPVGTDWQDLPSFVVVPRFADENSAALNAACVRWSRRADHPVPIR
jgi:hypothetical protein